MDLCETSNFSHSKNLIPPLNLYLTFVNLLSLVYIHNGLFDEYSPHRAAIAQVHVSHVHI